MRPTKKKHSKKRWSSAETSKLIDMWEDEVPISEISQKLGREEAVVRAKVSSLRARSPKLEKQLYRRMQNYKLDAGDIPSIRNDPRSLRLIGADYGIAPTTVFRIKNKETWKHVR